jgi:hypothetical protein
VGWHRGGLYADGHDILPSTKDLAVGTAARSRSVYHIILTLQFQLQKENVLAANEPSLQQTPVFKNLILWTPRSHASRRYLLFIYVLVQSIGEIIT